MKLTQCYDCGSVVDACNVCPSCGGETQEGYHKQEGIGSSVLYNGIDHVCVAVFATYNQAKAYVNDNGGIIPSHMRSPSGMFMVLKKKQPSYVCGYCGMDYNDIGLCCGCNHDTSNAVVK